IEPVKKKQHHEIQWPNVIRIDHIYKPTLTLENVTPIELDPYDAITQAELAALIAGKPNVASLSEIDLKEIAGKFRLQTIVFETAKRIYNNENPNWKGSKEIFLVQLIRIIEQFIQSDKIRIKNDQFSQDRLRRRILIMLNMSKIVQHLWNSLRAENTEELTPVFDCEHPIRSTGDMRTWYTSRPCEWTEKSHINHVVVDSTWEASEAYIFDKSDLVKSYIKNDHLGFAILYNYQGIIRKFYPDFIIKMMNGDYLILETKGQDSEQNKSKRAFLDEWVKAINTYGGFGKWKWDVSFHPSDLEGILFGVCNQFDNKGS
ncbi:MAG: type III restriction endonuclease subunit R, partial [bacterium]|nr:type III restriction endonuclease subunit R [bacterium]